MSPKLPSVSLLGLALSGMCLLALSACFEEEEKPVSSAAEGEGADLQPAGSEAPWLGMTESETPLAFLARHSGASEAELGPGLASAAALYRESERMIANRLLALWLEKGEEERQEEGFLALLAGFAHGKRGEVQSIGAVIQHYRMLRGQGYGHEAALDFAMGRKDAP